MTNLAMGDITVANNTWIPNIQGGSITIGGNYQQPGYVYQIPANNWGIASGANGAWNLGSASPAGFQVNSYGDWNGEEFEIGTDFAMPTEDEMEMAEAVAKWKRHFKI